MVDQVLIELGARNAAQPSSSHVVAPYLREVRTLVPVSFPRAQFDVLSPERTFWEKVTLAHAENTRSGKRALPDRYARHWYDLHMFARHAGLRRSSLEDRNALSEVIKLKSALYSC